MVDVIVGGQAAVSVEVPVVGALVRVRVPGTPGGYMWQVTGLDGSVGLVDVVHLPDLYADLPMADRPIGGVPDREFLFTTGAPGRGLAILELSRPWEGPAKRLRLVEVTFNTGVAEKTAAPAAF